MMMRRCLHEEALILIGCTKYAVLDRVVEAFKVHYKPQKNLSIDESMVGFKGRLAWIQYMPKKPRKWGIKIWTLADAANGYVSNMKVHTGKLE